MLFNSHAFLFVFLPLTLLAYWRTESRDLRKVILVSASYVFYGVWSIKFAFLMLATTSVDYWTATQIEDATKQTARRFWLALSLACNLGVLGVFKYYDFVAGSINDVVAQPLLPLLHVALPIGISFYTFESMSYTIDVYRREVTALRRFIDYAHFVTMFPRLVAGPIVRYRDMAEQIRTLPARLAPEVLPEALHLFTLGLAKKVLIADLLASKLVDPAFHSPGALTASEGWAAALGYTAQLYFDFSGYSDMAVGLALLVGFRLPRNFNLPYAAENVSDFWRRWHISLSTWLRDYLYIPLGGNRVPPWRRHLNLFLTMLLGGLWHGANWTFVIWGAYHGLALALYNGKLARAAWLPRWGAIAVTFIVVVFGWVMFRAASVGDALSVYRAMLGAGGLGATYLRSHVTWLCLLSVALFVAPRFDTTDLWPRMRTRWHWAAIEAVVFVLCLSRLTVPSPFLYFQF